MVKKLIPKISETEMIALRSGGYHIDREIFAGKVNYNKLYIDKPKSIPQNEYTFIRSTVTLLKEIGTKSMYPNDQIDKIMNNLGKKGFFSMIIPEKYGGNPISFTTQIRILTKITSYNPSLGVVVMVPNSLGPSELIHLYGSNEQKKKYLYKLATGDYIPCFALTGPRNGSDATGSIDEGIIKQINGKKYIEITLNKRYITLAPVANLIGIAFYLKDPEKLLLHGKEGITVALLERGHNGLQQTTYHDPNGAGFPNGTIKGRVLVDVDNIIGGEENAGNGWKMLMECLAVGRGISLPSSANGSAKLSTFGIYHYIQHRQQFNIPIGNMEAIQEKFVKMYYHAFIINAGVHYMAHILDKKITPSVLTAIMKQQSTERARHVINLGMDIYAGSGICLGKNNFFSKLYQSAPIGITVEGSNTLTRSLIIFGQGLNKSHPHIYDIFKSIQEGDETNFAKHFLSMVKDTLSIYTRSVIGAHEGRLENLVTRFSNLCNFIALLGGKIKSEQMLSGHMADILSNIFMAHAVKWYCHHHLMTTDNYIENFIIDELCCEAEQKMNIVIDNYPNNFLLRPCITKIPNTDFKKIKEVYKIIRNDACYMNDIKKDLYYEDTVIEKLERLSQILSDSEEYRQLYDEVIQVGEFPI